MSLITCKIELKFKWAKYCPLSATGNVHTNERPKIIWWNYIVTYINYIVTLSKLLSKGFERSIYWNEYKTKRENENMANEFRYFLKSNFIGVNRFYSNQDADSKIFKT